MFEIKKGENGLNYVSAFDVSSVIHVTAKGNSKTGSPVGSYNFPVEQSCNHKCECYKSKACYACGGFYQMPDNMKLYAENLSYFLTHTSEEFIESFCENLKANGNKLFRYFTIGDILNRRFFDCMIENARRMPNVHFWSYTKKYNIVNAWVEENGIENFPENLTIIFSHWLNEDGTYFPMENPYNFPTSEFIPAGKEYLAETVTHICPCSDPNVLTTCATCEHACYTLKHGESMALLEHSTSRTKQRDKAVKAAHNAIKESRKAERKTKKAKKAVA